MNSVPLSVMSKAGAEKRVIQESKNAVATVFAVLLGMGVNITYLLKASVITTMYLLMVKLLRGPIRSMWTR